MIRGAGITRVTLTSKAGTTERTVNIRWLPTRSWIQNLLLTPCYADNLMSFTDHARVDYKVHIMHWAQQRCVRTSLFLFSLRRKNVDSGMR